MASTLAEFLISIGYKADDKALADAEKKGAAAAGRVAGAWKRTVKEIGAAFTGIAGAFAGAGAAIFKFVDDATKAGDEVAKSARAAGIASDAYQRLAFASKRSGVDVDQLAMGVRTLNKGLHEASTGGAQGLTHALESLGLNAQILRKAGPEQQLGLIADALQNVHDPAERVALMAEIFGNRAGPQLASLLGEGSNGIAKLGAEAERLGLVIDNKALTASEEFQDQLGDLKATVGAMARDLARDLVPAMKQVIGEIKEWFAQNRGVIGQDMASLVKNMGTAFKALVPILDGVAFAVGKIAGAIIATGEAIGDMAAFVAGLPSAEERKASDREFEKMKARNAVKQAQGVNLGKMSDEQFEGLVGKAMRAGESDDAIAALERRRAREQRDIQGKLALEQFNAQLESGTLVSTAKARAAAMGGGKKTKRRRGGGSRREDLEIDFGPEDFEAEDLFGEEIDRLSARSGATQQARISAIKAAGSSLKSGASRNVARQAAISQLSSLTGRDFSPSTDRTLAELLGDDMQPDVRIADITQGTTPQVLTSIINNTFEIDQTYNIDGTQDPKGVANDIARTFRELMQDDLRRTSEYVKIHFDR